MASWLGAQTSFVGCIGSDSLGAKLVQLISTDGVTPLLEQHQALPTAISAIIREGPNHAFVIQEGAAVHITMPYIQTQ
jgi:sugar/nucleoside kinase (ribokinase family)